MDIKFKVAAVRQRRGVKKNQRRQLMTFSQLVQAELQRARKKFGPIHSMHEGKAVIEEELEEFWEVARSWKGGTSKSLKQIALTELTQIAAMAQRTAEDLGFIEEEAE
jgi:hypothetical protein